MQAETSFGTKKTKTVNSLAGFPTAVPQLVEEGGKHRHVRSGGSLAAQVGIDHAAARIDRDAVAEVVGGVENGPSRFARWSFQILA